jgi:paraquat-inducible protein B
MSEHRPPTAVVHARGHRRRRISAIWSIPIVTFLLGAWLVWHTLDERGPLITVTFKTAEGLTAGTSKVRHKDVEMGAVERITLLPDLKGVAVTIRMNKESTPLLTARARFWVVKPRFFAGSVSGLHTVLSGAYIEFNPSIKPAEAMFSFTGLEDPPVLQADVPGVEFRLVSPRLGAMSLGSPIFFRDQLVGEVLGWDVAEMAERVTIHAFVRAPFDQYVRDSTRFWNASGISLAFGNEGLHVQLESMRALLLGGIAFDTPAEGATASRSPSGHQFTLYPTKEAADTALYIRSPPLAAVFTGSVAGLTAGSEVRLRGLKVGEVESVRLEYNATHENVVAVARFYVEPSRIAHMTTDGDASIRARLALLVHRGLKVRIDYGNVVTGSKVLTPDLFPDDQPTLISARDDAIVIPTIDSSGDMIATMSFVFDRLATMPFAEIGRHLSDTLAGTSALTNDPNVQALARVLKATAEATQGLIGTLNKGMEPLAQRLPAITRHLDEAITRTERLMASIEAGYGANSQLNRDTGRLLTQFADAARSIRVLADLLSRHPEALIRGRTGQGP